jgi:hypothetical protein
MARDIHYGSYSASAFQCPIYRKEYEDHRDSMFMDEQIDKETGEVRRYSNGEPVLKRKHTSPSPRKISDIARVTCMHCLLIIDSVAHEQRKKVSLCPKNE